jgi:hypothetical protein
MNSAFIFHVIRSSLFIVLTLVCVGWYVAEASNGVLFTTIF